MEKPAGKAKPIVRDTHRKAGEAFLDSLAGPFRRGGMSKALYPLTSPRSRVVADQLADAFMRELARSGRIQRHGHLHWVKIAKTRQLRSGRVVPEQDVVVELPLSTRCPRKWMTVDLEQGEVFVGDVSGWRKATAVERAEAIACLVATERKA